MITTATEWAETRHLVDAAIRRVLGKPGLTCDACLILADAYAGIGAQSLAPEGRAIAASAAARLRALAPFYPPAILEDPA